MIVQLKIYKEIKNIINRNNRNIYIYIVQHINNNMASLTTKPSPAKRLKTVVDVPLIIVGAGPYVLFNCKTDGTITR